MRPVLSLIFPDFLFLKGLRALPSPKMVPGYREKLIFSCHCTIPGSNAVLLNKCLVPFVSGNCLQALVLTCPRLIHIVNCCLSLGKACWLSPKTSATFHYWPIFPSLALQMSFCVAAAVLRAHSAAISWILSSLILYNPSATTGLAESTQRAWELRFTQGHHCRPSFCLNSPQHSFLHLKLLCVGCCNGTP